MSEASDIFKRIFMKRLLIGLFCFSALAQAENLSVTVKNFNFTYKDPHGEGSAEAFSRSPAFVNEAVSVSVDKVGDVFKLGVSGAESHDFEFKDAPSFMLDAESMQVSGFHLTLTERLNLALAQGRFYSKDDTLKLDGMNLDCSRDVTQTELMDQLISGCVQRMSLKSSKFSSASADKTILGLLSQSILLAIDANERANVGVNSVDLKTNSGKYTLGAEVKAQISGKVKSNGFMSYDATNGKLSIKISEVKFGILNITGKVFDELKKQESDKLQVKEPYVHYTMK